MSSSNRPAANQPEQINSSLSLEEKQTVSLERLLTREMLRIIIVGGGVATALFPFESLIKTIHKYGNILGNANRSKSGLPGLPAAGIPGTTLAAARALLNAFAHSAQASILKNAAITQRGKLLNSDKVSSEEKSDLRTEEREDSNANADQPLTRVAGVTAAIAFVDSTLTQHSANRGTWHLHHLQEKNKSNFALPRPSTWREFLKTYKAGYPLRYARNNIIVGGLLAAPYLEVQLKPYLSTDQSKLAAVTATGCAAGFVGNALNMLYNNQIIQINQSFETPSAYQVGKELLAKHGLRMFARGFVPSMLHTTLAYSAVRFMEEEVAKPAVPAIEKAVESVCSYANSFFSQGKTTHPEQSKTVLANTTPLVEEVEEVAVGKLSAP